MLKDVLAIMTRAGDKAGFGGSLVSAMGCPACFPALAGLGSALGLGFLGQWEGVLVGSVLPIVASIVLVLNLLGWFSHRQWQRSVLGVIGPVLILIGARTMNGAYLYPGLAFMLGVSIWDMVAGRNRRCDAVTDNQA
ncbi:MAG: organomercurial transporter MerC [Pseudomonadales bacterium]|nr:organomercurial transporter MerC [Pseudomonadales bacterium]